jgi:hypothetical protein
MNRPLWVVILAVALGACRGYELESRLSDQGGVLPADQFARYGREQAQAVAIAREYGHAYSGSSPMDLNRQADSAMRFARQLPDVADVRADPLGQLLTVRFKSGWRTMVTPIDDGKRGSRNGREP